MEVMAAGALASQRTISKFRANDHNTTNKSVIPPPRYAFKGQESVCGSSPPMVSCREKPVMSRARQINQPSAYPQGLTQIGLPEPDVGAEFITVSPQRYIFLQIQDRCAVHPIGRGVPRLR